MEAARSAALAPVGVEPLTVRWHARGGAGAKTAAMLLAEVVIDAGGYAQASPEFGPERRGAPVAAFTRIGAAPIHRRGPVERPDVLVVLDPRLLGIPAVTADLTSHTRVIVNAASAPTVPGVAAEQVVAVDASAIARRTLGRDIPNMAILAAVVMTCTALDPQAFLSWLEHRLAEEFRPEIVAANLRAVREAMEEVRSGHGAVLAGV